jgi:hypothetical protein
MALFNQPAVSCDERLVDILSNKGAMADHDLTLRSASVAANSLHPLPLVGEGKSQRAAQSI